MRHRALPFAFVAVLALVGLVAPESTLRATQLGTPTSPLGGASSQSGATVTPVGTRLPSSAVLDYVALGDSIASGHGLQDADAPCRRSGLAYPAKVHAQLERDHGPVAFVHLACSGATALPPFAPPDDPLQLLPTQVDQALAGLSDRPTLVSLTIGSNDYNFADPSHMFDRLLVNDEPTFRAFADTIATQVRNAVGDEVRRLLERPNVAVVLTEVYNPFNTASLFFNARADARIGCALSGCYDRVEYAIDGVNAALRGVVDEVGQPARLAMTVGVRDAFREHAAPSPSCGSDPPDIALTWIQYRDDPASNAYPPNMPEWVAGAGNEWRGDCIHPNEPGARHYAEAVHAAAQPALPTLLGSARSPAPTPTTPLATGAPELPPVTPQIELGQPPSASIPAAELAVIERRTVDLAGPDAPPDADFLFALSPDGQTFYTIESLGSALCFYDVVTLASRSCVDFRAHGIEVDEESLVWSPDSTRVAFTEEVGSAPESESDVWVLEVAAGSLSHLTDDGVTGQITVENQPPLYHLDATPAWSPDGRMLAFARNTIRDGVGQGTTLYQIDAGGGEPTEVLALSTEGRLLVYPFLRWSSDGAKLVFTRGATSLERPRRSPCRLVDGRRGWSPATSATVG